MSNTKINPIHKDDVENLHHEEQCFFIYNGKKDYYKQRTNMFNEIKESIIVGDLTYKLLIYSGLYDYFKLIKIHKILKKNLNILTRFEQKEWVANTCWQILKIAETGFDSIPSDIIRVFRNEDIEKFIYDLIYNSLMGINFEGYLTFIEEKNIYMNEDDGTSIEEFSYDDDEEILPNDT